MEGMRWSQYGAAIKTLLKFLSQNTIHAKLTHMDGGLIGCSETKIVLPTCGFVGRG